MKIVARTQNPLSSQDEEEEEEEDFA